MIHRRGDHRSPAFCARYAIVFGRRQSNFASLSSKFASQKLPLPCRLIFKHENLFVFLRDAEDVVPYEKSNSFRVLRFYKSYQCIHAIDAKSTFVGVDVLDDPLLTTFAKHSVNLLRKTSFLLTTPEKKSIIDKRL